MLEIPIFILLLVIYGFYKRHKQISKHVYNDTSIQKYNDLKSNPYCCWQPGGIWCSSIILGSLAGIITVTILSCIFVKDSKERSTIETFEKWSFDKDKFIFTGYTKSEDGTTSFRTFCASGGFKEVTSIKNPQIVTYKVTSDYSRNPFTKWFCYPYYMYWCSNEHPYETCAHRHFSLEVPSTQVSKFIKE